MHVSIYESGEAGSGFRRSFFSSRVDDSPRVIGIEAPLHTIDPAGDLLIWTATDGKERKSSPEEVIELARSHGSGFQFAA